MTVNNDVLTISRVLFEGKTHKIVAKTANPTTAGDVGFRDIVTKLTGLLDRADYH